MSKRLTTKIQASHVEQTKLDTASSGSSIQWGKNVPVHILHLQLLRILSYRSLMTWLYMWRLFQLGSITLHAWAAEDFHCKMCHLRCKRFVRFDKIVKKSGFSINLLSTWHLGMCIYHHVPARHSTLPTKMYTMCGIAFLKCISYLELHS